MTKKMTKDEAIVRAVELGLYSTKTAARAVAVGTLVGQIKKAETDHERSYHSANEDDGLPENAGRHEAPIVIAALADDDVPVTMNDDGELVIVTTGEGFDYDNAKQMEAEYAEQAAKVRARVRAPIGAFVRLVLDPCSDGERPNEYHQVEVLGHTADPNGIVVKLPHWKEPSAIDITEGDVLEYEVLPTEDDDRSEYHKWKAAQPARRMTYAEAKAKRLATQKDEVA